MEKHEREKQALAELDRAFGDNLAKAGQAMNQSGAAKESTTPYEEFKQLISQMQATARQQQLKTEQTIQQTLQQAATALADAQKTDLITQQILVAQQALNQQGPNNNPQYYSQVLKQLQTQVQEQLHQTDQRWPSPCSRQSLRWHSPRRHCLTARHSARYTR